MSYAILKAALLSTVLSLASAKAHEPVKNIIFLIGDGMGLAHVSAAMTANKAPLNIERCTTVGLIKTHSANAWVTDSAAAGTALSSGYKTHNGVIGIRPDKQAGKTLFEEAKALGKATGAVVTSAITHATPASFLAHREHRKMEEEIAEDIVQSDVDLFIGGGRTFFESRSDGRNLSDALRAKKYTITYSVDDSLRTAQGKLGVLLAPQWLPEAAERGDLMERSVSIALRSLSTHTQGFVLMIEGSSIDYYSHKNDAQKTLAETLDFDRLVRRALDFADAHPGTLVVVTADHETGGMTLHGGNLETGEVDIHFSSKKHTGIMVPVYAYGTGAEQFSGIYDNTEIFHKMMRLLKPVQPAIPASTASTRP